MFKRYKLQPKKHKPLSLRTRKIEVSHRISDENLKILAMLKHSSSTVRMRGAREAEKMETVSEEMVKEVMKMCQSEKKEVRAAFYNISERLVAKSLPSEKKVWEELLVLYMGTMKTCTVIDVRRDSLKMLDTLIRHFPERLVRAKHELIAWLENDLRIVSLEPEHEKWKLGIEKRIPLLKGLKQAPHIKANYTDKIEINHSYLSINSVIKKRFISG